MQLEHIDWLHGLWAALAIFAAFRGLTLALWYPRLLQAVAGAPGGAASAKPV